MTDDSMSILDEQLSSARANLARTTVISPPGSRVDLLCTVPVDFVQVQKIVASGKRLDRGAAAEGHGARALVATFCEELLTPSGQPIEIDGERVNFRSLALQHKTHSANAADCAFAFFGGDAPVLYASNRLMAEAGFDPDLLDSGADPTL